MGLINSEIEETTTALGGPAAADERTYKELEPLPRGGAKLEGGSELANLLMKFTTLKMEEISTVT
jgi:hypothetical protein